MNISPELIQGHNTASYLLEALHELGVEYIFANLGTDHVSLFEALADCEARGYKTPQVVLCPHENVAVHMAGGFAAMTGRGQAVLVHVDVGSANAALGLHNLFRRRTPVLVLAGRAPVTLHGELLGSRDHYVHYMQDPFDIASLVRPFIKWEYDLTVGINVKEVFTRMYAVAHSAPAGPVYLTMAREVLAQEWTIDEVKSYSQKNYGHVLESGCSPEISSHIASRIMSAKKPVVITSYLGRSAGAVEQLEELALSAGVCVVEHNPIDLNMRRDSICHAGFDPRKTLLGADLVLFLDVDVPWLGHDEMLSPNAFIIHVDIDTIKRDLPMWGFASHMRVQGDCATVLEQVRDALAAQSTPAFEQQVQARLAVLKAAYDNRMTWLAAARASPGKLGAIAINYLCHCLNEVLLPEDIIVNEAVRNTGAVLNHINRTVPGSYLSSAGGGLGYSGAMALGAKLACPKRRVVQIVGDGSFHLGTPTSVYAVAQEQVLPIFTIVLDNAGWAAVRNATELVYPHGVAARAKRFQSNLGGAERRFDAVAAAFGAHGESVEDPDLVPAAIVRCLDALQQGRAALLQVSIGSHGQ